MMFLLTWPRRTRPSTQKRQAHHPHLSLDCRDGRHAGCEQCFCGCHQPTRRVTEAQLEDFTAAVIHNKHIK